MSKKELNALMEKYSEPTGINIYYDGKKQKRIRKDGWEDRRFKASRRPDYVAPRIISQRIKKPVKNDSRVLQGIFYIVVTLGTLFALSWIYANVKVVKAETLTGVVDAMVTSAPTNENVEVAPKKVWTGVTTYDSLFMEYFGEDWEIMRAICRAESGLQNIRSYQANDNGTYDHGICQINDVHSSRVDVVEELYNPETNIRIARDIYKEQGLGAWSVYTSGKYKIFMEEK